EERPLGPVDEVLLGVGHGAVDVGPAAELGGEEHVDGIVEERGDVDDLGVEEEEAGAEDVEGGEDRGHDGAVDDALGHGSGLVDEDGDVLLVAAALVLPEVEALGDEAAAAAVPAAEVLVDGAAPVDVAGDAEGARAVAAEGAEDGGAHLGLELLAHLVDDLADDGAGRLAGAVGDEAPGGDEGGDELDVLLQEGEGLGLEEELGQALALDGVLLDEGDDVVAEELAQGAEPGGDVGAGGAEARGALLVEEGEGAVEVVEAGGVDVDRRRETAEGVEGEGGGDLLGAGAE